MKNKFTPHDAESFDNRPMPHVRYRGFEGTLGGRRLLFSVAPNGQQWHEVTIEVPDAMFIGAAQLSMQDAAPMAYEKLVELLTERPLEPDDLCLTDADIVRYKARHLTSQKRRFGVNRPDVAA
jgi:hypothetical protein